MIPFSPFREIPAEMKSEETLRAAGALLGTMRTRVPLVHCLTNHVVTNFTANVLLAAGAAPAMIHDPEESSIFAGVALTFATGTGFLAWPDILGLWLSMLFGLVLCGICAYGMGMGIEKFPME